MTADNTLSERFFAELARLGERRGSAPEIFLTVWCAESGLVPTAINHNGGARGLNQMMPSTLRSLGAPADFEQLRAEEQLPWIERLIAAREQLNGGPFRSAARYYHSNFFPRTMARGSSPETIVIARDADEADERSAYAANIGLDADGDGKITLADLTAVLERVRRTRCQEAFARLSRAVDALGASARVTRSSRRHSPAAFLVASGVAFGIASLALWRGP